MRKRISAGEPVLADTSRLASFSSTLMGEEIARRAYEIFQARGVPDGTELEDWLQAERDLLALIARGS